MRTLILLIVLSLFATAQPAAPNNWGYVIKFGTAFQSTDSLKLTTAGLRDTVLADTIYSDALPIGEHTDGILGVAAHLSNVAGGSDSLVLEVRLVYQFYDVGTWSWLPWEYGGKTIKFGPWNNVFNLAAAGTAAIDTSFSSSTSSWWGPASYRQYRWYDTSVSVDTTIQLTNDYSR